LVRAATRLSRNGSRWWGKADGASSYGGCVFGVGRRALAALLMRWPSVSLVKGDSELPWMHRHVRRLGARKGPVDSLIRGCRRQIIHACDIRAELPGATDPLTAPVFAKSTWPLHLPYSSSLPTRRRPADRESCRPRETFESGVNGWGGKFLQVIIILERLWLWPL